MTQKVILGISGSPRPGGNTDTLLRAVLRGAAEARARGPSALVEPAGRPGEKGAGVCGL